MTRSEAQSIVCPLLTVANGLEHQLHRCITINCMLWVVKQGDDPSQLTSRGLCAVVQAVPGQNP